MPEATGSAWGRRIAAAVLALLAGLVLMLGSCAIPGAAYITSPKWTLQEVGPEPAPTFFVARGDDEDAAPRVVERWQPGISLAADPRYRLAEGRHACPCGLDGKADIVVDVDPNGNRTVRVFVVGDTAWSSLSEYRVEGDKVQPLRHAQSASWILIGAPLMLLVVHFLLRPIRRRIDRLLRVERA